MFTSPLLCDEENIQCSDGPLMHSQITNKVHQLE